MGYWDESVQLDEGTGRRVVIRGPFNAVVHMPFGSVDRVVAREAFEVIHEYDCPPDSFTIGGVTYRRVDDE